MLEPLPDLIRAVTRCAHASDGTAAPSGAMRTLGGMVGQMVAGFCRCSLRSLGLSDKAELSQGSPGCPEMPPRCPESARA